MVLADAAARGESLVGAEGGVRAAGLIGHQHQDACHPGSASRPGSAPLAGRPSREILQGRGPGG